MSKSIFLLLLFLFIMIALFYVFKKVIQPSVNRVYKWRGNLLLAGVYLAVLIFLMPITALIDQGESFISQNPDKELLALAPENWSENERVYPIPGDGHFENLSGMYRNSSQTFTLEVPQLEIRTIEQTGYEMIYLERKESADGVVEVSTYVAPHYARSSWSVPIDFTKLVAPPQISIEKGIMKIKAPMEQNLVFRHFRDNFTVSQFKPEVQNSGGGFTVHGHKAILIRIPSDVEVFEGDSGKFNWVAPSSP